MKIEGIVGGRRLHGDGPRGGGRERDLVEAKSQNADQRVDMVRIFLLQKRRGVLVGDLDDERLAIDAGEARTRNPVFETLGAQLLFELFLDEIPGALMLTIHKT